MQDHMSADQSRLIVVTGATGLQGGQVARQLHAAGWRVRALTRDRNSAKAQALAAQGIEVAQGDMNDPASLAPVFEGAYGVFSVQNPMLSGVESEIRQGKNVGDTARQAGLQHFVYASAGTGAPGTGVPSWESKLAVEAHLKSLGLPLTILRPMAFMELMTDAKFFPQVAVWHVMPQMMGSARPVGWLSARDVGVIVAKAFADRSHFIGQDLKLASDVQSIDACRRLYAETLGRNPPRFPLPPWLFQRFGFVGHDLGRMWRWLRTGDIPLDIKPTLALLPEALTVRAWLATQRPS
jgi:uncharacterized protein YbjT (DUF2867 family)